MSKLHRVVCNGATVSFRRQGRGRPCLVIGSDLYYERALPSALRDELELIYCNVRHWVSPDDCGVVDAISMQTYADDIEAIRRSAGVERPLVLGQSVHGTIALEYARHYPEQAAGVIVIASPAVGLSELGQQALALWESDASPARRAVHARNLSLRKVPPVPDTPQDVIDGYLSIGAMCWYEPTFDASTLWSGVEANVRMFNKLYLDLLYNYTLAPLDVPVLLILGRHDYVVPYTSWQEPMRQLSQLRYELYARSAHAPQFEEPQRFVDDVTSWMRTLGS